MVPADKNMVFLEASMLTDSKIRNAAARPRPYKLGDAHQLYLIVTPSGGKLWRMNYSYDFQQKSLALGRYPLVSLCDARAKRDDARRLLAEGRDPNVAKRLKIDAQLEAHRNTFEKVARDWHAMNKPQWAAHHADDVMRSLERDLFPALGKLPITELTPPVVVKALRSVEERGAIETAKRARQRVSAVCVYAIAEGIADKDPAEKLGAVLKPLRKRKRQAAITDIKLLQQMMNDAEKGYARPITHLALRLLALTVVRPGELRGARWEEFEDLDTKEPLWRIPAARMKGDLDRKEEEGGCRWDGRQPWSGRSCRSSRACTPVA